MTAIITNKFRIDNATRFKDTIDNEDTTKNLYFFIGKPDSWTSEISPETTVDSVSEETKRWYDMISLKKVDEANISHAIPRVDWDSTGNTKYVAYSHTDYDLFNHPTNTEIEDAVSDGTYTAGSFYVMTDEYNVYKCLFNNNNAKSTTKPTGRSTSAITTADGYIWKYMYTVSSSDILKYVTPEWIPVKTLTVDDSSNQWEVQDASVDGSIEVIKVTAGGSGYTNVITNGTLVAGSSGGGTLPNTASAVDSAYVNATIFILTGTGAGQRRKITAYTGSSRAFTVDSNWSVTPNGTSTFDILPTVTISGDGSGALAKPTVSGGAITKIAITSMGADYRSASVAITGGGGTGATATAIISPLGGHGSDPIQELCGKYIIADIRLEYTEGDFPIANDYRRVGLISNVKNSSDGEIATASTRSAVKSLTLTSVVGTFLADEVITSDGSGTPNAKIVEFGSTGVGTGSLKFFQDSTSNFLDFASTQHITGQTSGATATISAVVDSEILPFVGDILYVENRRPIMRSENQVENFKTVMEF